MSKNFSNILSIKFWKAFWMTMRPYLNFLSGSAGLAGMAFIQYQADWRILLGFLPLFFSYGLGQALTDCFQTDTDAISSPYRPLIKGLITKKQVLIASLFFLFLGAGIMAILNFVILFLGVLSIFGLSTYSILKKIWWAGPQWNAWIVALLPIMGRFIDKDYRFADITSFSDENSTAFFMVILAIFFGYMDFVIIGYFKDITADRKTGYNTFTVVFGWKPAAFYSNITALISTVLIGLSLLLLDNPYLPAITCFVIGVLLNLYAQIKIHLIRKEAESHKPITNVVRAFILYCLAIVLTLKAAWIIPILFYYLLFELTLKNRPEISQV